LADELSGFLKRMNQYKAGDEAQKWLELWSGSSIMMQRIGRDEDKVSDPYCSVVGGIQPGVLETLSKEENAHNGFYHRFLFVYPQPQEKVDWKINTIPHSVKQAFNGLFSNILDFRNRERTIYTLEGSANDLYAAWFNNKNKEYNDSQNDDVKGIIAKYQHYCLRFSLIIQIMHDGAKRPGVVLKENMERAIRLTEYFFRNMDKALKILSPETPLDKLNPVHKKFYDSLPRPLLRKQP
jgi:hypothetical protein